jgi:hypothetical protein
VFTDSHGQLSGCFTDVASATFIWNAIDTVPSVLSPFLFSLSKVKIVSVFIFEDGRDIIAVLYALELLQDALDILDIILTRGFSSSFF